MTPRRRKTLVAAALLGILAWGAVDVPRRSAYDPNHPLDHRTDFTVYTAAGAALKRDEDPYEVANPRGWHYLYPPLFALLVAPLSGLDPLWQGVVWFLVSVACLYGCYVEARKIFLRLERDRKREAAAPTWIRRAAMLAVLFPVLNTLQRGQVGLAVLYPLLLGFRLLFCGAGPRAWALGGFLLALPVAIKVTPALPVAVLFFFLLVASIRERSAGRLFAAAPAALFGAAFFFLLFPAAFLGWGENVHLLHRWVQKVGTNERLGTDDNFNARSARNQSLQNGLFRMGNFCAHVFAGGPDDRLADLFPPPATRLPMDTPAFYTLLKAARALLVLLLLGAAAVAARGRTAPAEAAIFGLSAAFTLPISPISWGHHYVLLLPAALFVPYALWLRGRAGAARLLSLSAAALLLLHYALLEVAGRIGLLGVGFTVWCIGAAVLLVMPAAERPRASRGNAPPDAQPAPG